MEAMLATIEKVILLSANSPRNAAALDEMVVPGSGKTLSTVLNESVRNRTVDPSLITALAEVLHSIACQMPAKSKKRKRDGFEEEDKSTHPAPSDTHLSRVEVETPAFQTVPFPVPQMSLIDQVHHAIAVVHGTLTHSIAQGIPLDRNAVASIQGPLHHVFLFCATSAVGPATRNVEVLQEISGLVQILGILHDVVIISASMADPLARAHQTIYNSGTPLPVRQLQSIQANFQDIGTAVYPCLYPACGKTFSKLFQLRKHEALHSFDRPFKCPRCPAAFARKYDFKRHEKSHDTIVYRCGGCHRRFTRRDALRRHKANVKSSEACARGAIEEVQADPSDIQSSTRRVKAVVPSDAIEVDELEEGELPKEAIALAQDRATVLHPLLQRHVTEKLSASGNATRTGGSPPTGLSLSATSAGGLAAAAPLPGVAAAASTAAPPPKPSLLVGYNLNEEQTTLLERAIAAASEAARMQAELEAQLELESEEQGPGGADDGQEGE
ncbi:Metallothionein expression activator [Tulasnella sp. 424]|nr:Metallothionein expression activator [Tulasnella sp. 424]KAG8981053.1 Metallothionein expression activator [Tulasnella sp. 425]